mmetsp:Transcript_22001/g.69184  ORF Transcript_22001/g.69184 Transcript_22001/m.69184 type:complete len:321 (+) Transcript_22001:551-1513(+)
MTMAGPAAVAGPAEAASGTEDEEEASRLAPASSAQSLLLALARPHAGGAELRPQAPPSPAMPSKTWRARSISSWRRSQPARTSSNIGRRRRTKQRAASCAAAWLLGASSPHASATGRSVSETTPRSSWTIGPTGGAAAPLKRDTSLREGRSTSIFRDASSARPMQRGTSAEHVSHTTSRNRLASSEALPRACASKAAAMRGAAAGRAASELTSGLPMRGRALVSPSATASAVAPVRFREKAGAVRCHQLSMMPCIESAEAPSNTWGASAPAPRSASSLAAVSRPPKRRAPCGNCAAASASCEGSVPEAWAGGWFPTSASS